MADVYFVFVQFGPLDHIFQYGNATAMLHGMEIPIVWYIAQLYV